MGGYGEAIIPQGTPNAWAGYFKGNVNVTVIGVIPGGVWQNSDAQFKTNVQDLDNAMQLIASLEPKSYDFIPQEHPHLSVLEGAQMGLIAQELQQVLPALVRQNSVPALYD